MEGDVYLELKQEWDDVKECVEYLRDLAISIEENPLFKDKNVYLAIDEIGEEDYRICLATL